MQNDMTIKDLKSIINDLPDDMKVIIPVIDEDRCDVIFGFRLVRTAGILSSDYEDTPAFCLAAGYDNMSLANLVSKTDTMCEKDLF